MRYPMIPFLPQWATEFIFIFLELLQTVAGVD